MQTITATELRTNTRQMIDSLKKGEEFMLIHRSDVVGVIKPKSSTDTGKVLTQQGVDELQKALRELGLHKLSRKERDRRYRSHLMKKYGKGLS